MRAGLLLIMAILATGTTAAQSVPDCRAVPGWEPFGAMRQYNSGNLFDYKDGGAEGYLSFGFVRMSSIDCKSGANTLTIDISEMSAPDAAYGIFTANLDPAQPTAKIGMGGQIQPQSATFAKGNFYVEIVETAADPSTNDSNTMRAFAVAIESRVDGRSSPPEPLQWFVQQNLISARLVPESVLGLHELKRGYVAKYQTGQAFIVIEDSLESAVAAFKALRAHFSASPSQVGDESFQAKAEYLGGICVFRKGRILAGYANLPDPQQAVTQSAALAARIP